MCHLLSWWTVLTLEHSGRDGAEASPLWLGCCWFTVARMAEGRCRGREQEDAEGNGSECLGYQRKLKETGCSW